MKEFVEKLLNELNYQKEYNQIVYDAKPRTEHEKDLNAVLQSTYDSAIRIVKRLAGEYERENLIGWIPCSKSLPFTTGYYLVTIKGFNRPMYAWWLSTEKIWHYLNSTKVIDDVIAWCELPAPYQPKGE